MQLAGCIGQLEHRLVPLVEGDERRAAGFPGQVGDSEIVLDDAFAGVHEHERDIGPFGRLERP